MTTDEAIAWCMAHKAQVLFTSDGNWTWVRVLIYRTHLECVGASDSFVDAVLRASEFGGVPA